MTIFKLHSGHSITTFRRNAAVRRAGCVLLSAVLFAGQFLVLCPVSRGAAVLPVQATSRKEIPLPTPRSHYETLKPGVSGLPLLAALLKEVDPSVQQLLLDFAKASGLQMAPGAVEIDPEELKKLTSLVQAAGLPKGPPISKEQALSLLKQVNWAPIRPQVLEFFVHQSKILDMVPEKWGAIWNPIIHDALLYFLDHLSDDRLLEKLINLAYLPPGTERGDYLVEFVSKTPSLQKMGQILARNPDLSQDYRQALQRLENSIQTMTRDELVKFITEDVGKESLEKYQVQFADKILAEASVGAVIRSTIAVPGATERRDAICKVIKPYVLVYLPEDLAIIDGLAGYFTKEHDFYQLGSLPLVDMFQEIKRSLTKEIKIVDEQQNLVRAREYYKSNKTVVVPELFPISTEHVTFMEFIKGEKIIDSFPGQPKERAIMARRLTDVMTLDVIFAPKSEAIFHGDPHAGNVYHVANDPKDPYRIALLDWGLYGTFPRHERVALMQLLLGVQLRDAKRLRKYSGALLEHGLPTAPEKLQRIDAIIAEVVKPKEGRGSFEALQELLLQLVQEGYQTKFTLNLFVKSQITIAGLLTELDPTLKQDVYLEQRITGMVKSEMPKRFLYTVWFPAWNSRGYRSLLSNGDVVSTLRNKPKEQKKQKTVAAPAGSTSNATAKP